MQTTVLKVSRAETNLTLTRAIHLQHCLREYDEQMMSVGAYAELAKLEEDPTSFKHDAGPIRLAEERISAKVEAVIQFLSVLRYNDDFESEYAKKKFSRALAVMKHAEEVMREVGAISLSEDEK